MKKKVVIEFKKENENSEEIFEWLISRLHDYIEFLRNAIPKKDKKKWCEKFIKVLKFLGDYKLDAEMQKCKKEVNGEKNGKG